MKPNDETNNANEHDMVNNSNWREADQLAIYKHDCGDEPGSTVKQLQLAKWPELDLSPRPTDF